MYQLNGGCHCGNISVQVELPSASSTYSPRACDCDFCVKHGAAYISDPQGALRIRIVDERQRGTYLQGNEIAEMLLCTRCGVLIGALYHSGGNTYATLNARTIAGDPIFAPEQTISPKRHSVEEKTERWKRIWFSRVESV